MDLSRGVELVKGEWRMAKTGEDRNRFRTLLEMICIGTIDDGVERIESLPR